MRYVYHTHGTCSVEISFDIDENETITNISFTGGCPGNTKGICALCDGQSASYIVSKLKGITCGPRPTSCPDQLATAILEAVDAIHST
ncbi:MAG: TIGR03905 family TSCPD domain-containing protein [Coprobacillus sp.]|nr:TIGR03905 family TSCPD domain-containing protein [Coprobacillus sp.]